MDEEKLLDKIKNSAQDEHIPETLKPEKIIEKLPEKKRVNHFAQVYKWGALAAAVCVIVIGVALAGNYIGSRGMKGNSAPKEAAAQEAAQSAAGNDQTPFNGILAQAGSYEELYEKLENCQTDANATESAGVMKSAGEETGTPGTQQHGAGGYSDTNIQEAGVDEGDIVKTDGAYIYILKSDSTVRILKAQGDQVENVSLIEDFSNGGKTALDLYVAGDRLVLITGSSQADLKRMAKDVSAVETSREIAIYTYDILDRAAPRQMGFVTQEGEYAGSRLVDGYLYAYTNCYKYGDFQRGTVSGQEDSLIPSVGGSLLEPEEIYIPEELQDSRYLVFSSVSLENPGQVCDRKAVMSMSRTFYVSSGSIYLTGNENGGDTALVKLDFKQGEIVPAAAGAVQGSVRDNFSMSEYEGYLRVVTTAYDKDGSVNHLYVLDENMNITGRIENLALGETIRSARFLENAGYFVTYRNTDPLFSVDLSDPENPKILGELKLTGFSEYLHFYGEDRLFGLGYETDAETGEVTGLKLSMYDISEPGNVREVHKSILDLDGTMALSNYHALLIEPGKNIIGFAGEKWHYQKKDDGDTYLESYTCDYYLYTYDETRGFVSLAVMDRGDQNGYDTRGIYLGDTFYLVEPGLSLMKLYDMNNGYSLIKEIDF